MTSNAAKMSLEEKIVQKLKDETLFQMIGDEDSILELAKRALREALFQPTKVTEGSGYNARTVSKPSVVMQVAEDVAREAVQKAAREHIDALMKREDVQKLLREVTPSILVAVVAGNIQDSFTAYSMNAKHEAVEQVRDSLQRAGILDYGVVL